MDNLLECNICLDKYDNKEKLPRILRCGHTFCSKCLKELTRLNSNLEMNFPFVKCPLDKLIGHNNTKIEEIPINRLIVDILDYNGFQFDRLSIKEDSSNEKMTYINTAMDKLKNLEKNYSASYTVIKNRISDFITAKNNCIGEINDHFDKLINTLENQKINSMCSIEKFSIEKLGRYNHALQSLERFKDFIQIQLKKLEGVKNQKIIQNMPLADEINAIQSLGIETVENKEFQHEVELIVKEMQGDFLPKIVIKNEFDIHLEELADSLKVMLPFKQGNVNNYEMNFINENMERMNISKHFLWFQQNSKNIYRLCLNETDWLLADNKDNYVAKEMYRVCMIGADEALITGSDCYFKIGGINGYSCSNLTMHFKNGNFKKRQNMFQERRTHATCKAGDHIFVCGGINSKGDPLNSCEKYSLESERWYKISNMAIAKSHLSLCNFNSESIYSIGGENRYESLLDIIERYTVNTDIWDILTVKLPMKMECVACVQNNQDILILGGYSIEHGSLKKVYAFDTGNNTIRNIDNELPQPGWSIYQPLKSGNAIHLFYGGEEDFPPHHLVYYY